MSKRLPVALATAALCSLFGTLHAQTTDAPDPTGQQRYQQPSSVPPSEPADVVPSTTVPSATINTPAPVTTYEVAVPTNRELAPQGRDAVQADTRAAMRSGQILHGELSTPEQDKGSERALTTYERGLPPSSY